MNYIIALTLLNHYKAMNTENNIVKMEPLKNYCRIHFKNCGPDYDYTICEWSDVIDYIREADGDFDDPDENDKPQIIISSIQMTESDFGKFIEENYEK